MPTACHQTGLFELNPWNLQLIPLLVGQSELTNNFIDKDNPDVTAMWIGNNDLVPGFDHAGMPAASDRTFKLCVAQFSDEFVAR